MIDDIEDIIDRLSGSVEDMYIDYMIMINQHEMDLEWLIGSDHNAK